MGERADVSHEVPDARLLEIVDEAKELGVRDWAIAGGGEPMVRPDLVMRLCTRIREHGMNGFIISNGTQFTRDHIQTLVDIGWRRLVISLDGPSAEVNDAIRNAGSFERATETLRTFADIKRTRRVSSPTVCINAVITSRNYSTIPQLVQLAGDLGVSEITANVLQVRGSLCAEFRLTDEQRGELPEILQKAALAARKRGIETSFPSVLESQGVRDRDGYVKTGHKTKGTRPQFEDALCFEPFLSMTVTSRGGGHRSLFELLGSTGP